MSRKISKPTNSAAAQFDAAWAAIIKDVLDEKKARPDGDGWIDTEEFAVKIKCKRSRAGEILRARVKDGTMETEKAGSRLRSFYRPIVR